MERFRSVMFIFRTILKAIRCICMYMVLDGFKWTIAIEMDDNPGSRAGSEPGSGRGRW